jgi:hypothetical protein
LKTPFTEGNCTAGVRKEPVKVIRYIGTCLSAAVKTLWMEDKAIRILKEGVKHYGETHNLKQYFVYTGLPTY